eukprot:15471869-Alexandrium_andersonii.AAC.1
MAIPPVPWATDADRHLAVVTNQLRAVAQAAAPKNSAPRKPWLTEPTWDQLRNVRRARANVKALWAQSTMYVLHVVFIAWRTGCPTTVDPPDLRQAIVLHARLTAEQAALKGALREDKR